RTMRICPARRTHTTSTYHNYSMPVGLFKFGAVYQNADTAGSPYHDNAGNYTPSVKSLPKPSEFILLVESKGGTLKCNDLTSAIDGSGADPLPALQRHQGFINCLFGDYHVETLPAA